MFPPMGSIRQPGGNEFPFRIFSLAVLMHVGLVTAGAVSPPLSSFVVVEQNEGGLGATSKLQQ